MSLADYFMNVATASNTTAMSSSELLANMKECMAELENLKNDENAAREYFQPSFEITKDMLVESPPFASTYWEPTPWGPFATLEESDEHWARPLGLGRLVTREQLMLRCQDWAINYALKVLGVPSSIMFHTV